MNPIKKLVVVKHDWPSVTKMMKDQLKRTCRLHHTALSFVSKNTPHPVAVYEVSGADYVLIWNGSCPLSTWAVDVRKSLAKHYKIVEVGWAKQSNYWHFDNKGIGGKSSLCDKLPEPSREDWDKLNEKKEEYKKLVDTSFIKEMNLPSEYILCPFQVPHDVTIYYDAPYKFNNEFAEHVMNLFPDVPIVFKVHPKHTRERIVTERDDVYLVRTGDLIDYTPNAKLVYGQTSTSLVESALLGIPTVAIGNCALRSHSHSDEARERLLATMIGRQVDRELTTDLWHHITS